VTFRKSEVFEDEERTVLARFVICHWRWSAVPVCLLFLFLISPRDNDAAVQQEILAGRQQLASIKAKLDLSQRVGQAASVRLNELAATATNQGQALTEANQKGETLELDLATAQRLIKDLNSARHSMEVSLAEANKSLNEERQKAELSRHELETARQASDANDKRANSAAAERAAALKNLQVALAAVKNTDDVLSSERARSVATAIDLDNARRERDAATQASDQLSAALERERQRLTDMSVALTAARKAIELVKAQRSPRIARMELIPKARPAAILLSGHDSKPILQTDQDKSRSKIAKSSKRILVATTIALPDALLPTPPRQ
jgi:chromosome segregation ATPase